MFDLSSEFPQLKDQLYLDHSGAAIPSKYLLDHWKTEVSENIYGNPHSSNSPASASATGRINEIRSRIKRHLLADHNYHLIFTKNTTHALKIIAESIQWNQHKGHFCFLRQSHSSVIGMREYVPLDRVHAIDVEYLESSTTTTLSVNEDLVSFNVFVFPAQCNFTGQQFPFDWISKVKSGCLADLVQNNFPWIVVLDAAAYLSSSTISLKAHPADFVAFSFYKMFGFPTGVGALCASQDALKLLSRPYSGGGTVDSIAWDVSWKVSKPPPAMYEDGTLPFLEIMAIDHGFKFIDSIGGWQAVQDHVFGLAKIAKQEMASIMIRDSEGCSIPLCEFYSGSDTDKTTSVISFNLLMGKNLYIGYNYVAKLAMLHGINLRSGVFCNPGAASKALNLSFDDLHRHYLIYKRKCGDDQDIIEGKPTGAVRISFGLCNTRKDIKRWISFLKTFFVPDEQRPFNNYADRLVSGRLFNITLYPVKSCGGFSSTSWKIDVSGLSLDRHWMVVDRNGETLTQKICPNMAFVRPVNIDLSSKTVELYSPKCQKNLILKREINDQDVCTMVCGESSLAHTTVDIENDKWFSAALGISCHLVSCSYDRNRKVDEFPSSIISFANEAQFLCISKRSFDMINDRMLAEKKPQIEISRFRANLVIDDNMLHPFEEESWLRRTIQIGDQFFYVTELCERCSMICIDQNSGKKYAEPFITLAKHSMQKSKVCFGIFLQHDRLRSKKPYKIQIGHSIFVQ